MAGKQERGALARLTSFRERTSRVVKKVLAKWDSESSTANVPHGSHTQAHEVHNFTTIDSAQRKKDYGLHRTA
jgi:hypothetical protein